MAYRFTTAQRANRALYTLQVEKRIQRGLHWQTTTVSIVCTSLRRAYEMRRPGEVARIYRVEHDANGQERDRPRSGRTLATPIRIRRRRQKVCRGHPYWADIRRGTVDVSIASIIWRASAGSSTGALPRRTIWRGPRTAAAGLVGMIWPITIQSNR